MFYQFSVEACQQLYKIKLTKKGHFLRIRIRLYFLKSILHDEIPVE